MEGRTKIPPLETPCRIITVLFLFSILLPNFFFLYPIYFWPQYPSLVSTCSLHWWFYLLSIHHHEDDHSLDVSLSILLIQLLDEQWVTSAILKVDQNSGACFNCCFCHYLIAVKILYLFSFICTTKHRNLSL